MVGPLGGESGVVYLRIGACVIEGVQRLPCYVRQEMPVEETYGVCRFHRQYGQHQKEQRLGSRGQGISKNKQKILMESSNQAVFVVQGHFTL